MNLSDEHAFITSFFLLRMYIYVSKTKNKRTSPESNEEKWKDCRQTLFDSIDWEFMQYMSRFLIPSRVAFFSAAEVLPWIMSGERMLFYSMFAKFTDHGRDIPMWLTAHTLWK